MAENYFKQLYDIDVNDKKKEKNGLSYLSWSWAWSEVKKLFPDAVYTIYEEEISIDEVTEKGTIHKSVKRPWFDDGETGWVKTGVTVNGIEHIEELPILDFKNKSIPADKITSADANKSIQRSLTKACARHGLGLYIYAGEGLPEESKEIETLRANCMDLIAKKCALNDKTKEKVGLLCKEILPDENGNPKLCDDIEKLKELHKKLMAVRKIV